MLTKLCKLLGLLWRPARRIEWYCYIPLGWVRGRHYQFELDWYSVGWHYRRLLVTLDWNPARPGWRWQRQMKYRPLTDIELHTR